GVVLAALADRAVVQGTQGDAGAGPVPGQQVRAGGGLGAAVPGQLLLPGVVSGPPAAAGRPARAGAAGLGAGPWRGPHRPAPAAAGAGGAGPVGAVAAQPHRALQVGAAAARGL